MRWTDLTDSDDDQLPLPGAVRRTFNTPGFAGMTFYEVRAKSLINKIPRGRLPFEYTINPYRGCTHACTYCLAADTPILLPDGSTKPLDRVEVGDDIIGTVRDGRSRRFTVTPVRAKWPTVKLAYQVVLSNGVSLTASSEHQFLTDLGWKHVTASVAGPDRRAYLAPGDQVMAAFTGLSLAHLQETRLAPVTVVAVEPLGQRMPMWDLTTGTGDFIGHGVVSHNCFARHTHTYLDLDAGRDFDTQIVVKVNAVELLRRELQRPSWRGQSIAMGTNVDCYQRAEGRYELMPGIIEALGQARNPFSILTKGTLILRDLPLLEAAAQRCRVSVAMSIGFLDETLWRLVESGTPSPMRRLAALAELTAAGFRVGVLMAPILPGLSDSQESIDATVAALAQAGAAGVTPLALHLRPGAREWYQSWLSANRPDLVPLYRRIYGDRAYASADYQRLITARARRAMRRAGLPTSEASAREMPVTPDAPVQLTLL